jgi:outer membrane protein OmpA-like peptidoglycan-associated protein
MNGSRRWSVAVVSLLCCLAVGVAYGADKTKISGLITGRTGETLIVKTTDGNVTVVLTDDTKVQQPKGLGVRKKQMSAAVLAPGLKVLVEGSGDATRLVANSITFSGDDLEIAQSIQAGLTPTAHAVQANQQNIQANKEDIAANNVELAANREQIAANKEEIGTNQQEIQATNKRFSELSEYDTKGDATVYFTVGSTVIAGKDKTALMQLAHDAVNLTGYIIQVKGFADSSGNAAMNQQLSMERAQNVVAYLIQDCNIPVRHIVAPGAMGTADPAAPNETASGRADNRRVEVKVLVNRGVAGQ